jgi:serpin B
MAQSDEPRVISPEVPSDDMAALVSSNTAFAFDLYQVLAEASGEGANLFYSPYSISAALAMTYAGAEGETEQEMAETMHVTLPETRLHPAFNALALALAERGQGAEGKDGGGFRLHVVNALWGQRGYEFLQPFLDTLAQHYGAGLRLLDFSAAPEEARVTINDWVSEQTEGKIKDLIPQGAIDILTRLVLTNAIYFNAAWAEPFEVDRTDDGPFHALDDEPVMVPMMHQTAAFGYAERDGYQVVELPYDGHELSMVILLPDMGQFTDIEEALDVQEIAGVFEALRDRQVALAMPKFKVESSFSLVDALIALGMPSAFSSEAADFSGMDGTHDLLITNVFHKAFVDVDEAGTEAAAATAVIVSLESAMPAEPVKVTVDRPFVFLIRDIRTGSVLFVGRVMDPSK